MLLATVGIVVLASTGIHGASSTPIGAWYQRRASRNNLAEERTATADNLIVEDYSGVMLISPEQLYQMMLSPKQPIILDVRSVAGYERARSRIPGSVRVEPDRGGRVGETQPGRGQDGGCLLQLASGVQQPARRAGTGRLGNHGFNPFGWGRRLGSPLPPGNDRPTPLTLSVSASFRGDCLFYYSGRIGVSFQAE